MKLPPAWTLPETIQKRFGETHGKQRAMVAEGHLLLILHKLPKWGEKTRKSVLFWRNPEGAWQTTAGGQAIPALKKHVESYEKAEAELSARYEKADTAEDYFELLEHLGPMVHAARNLHATLQSARDAVGERDIIAERDAAAEVERNLDLLYQSARNGLDLEIAEQAEVQARIGQESIRVANRLNVLAAIFLPVTAISGIFGMNLAHGLPMDMVVIFWAVLFGGFMLGFTLKGWVMRGQKDD